MIPQSVVREVEVGEVLPTTEFVGFLFPGTAAGISSFLVSVPILGVIDILEVFWSTPETDNAITGIEFQLAVGGTTPADGTAMDALPQVFPAASDPSASSTGTWAVSGDHQAGSIRGRFRVAINGELLVARHAGGLTAGASASLGVVYERVIMEQVHPLKRQATGRRPRDG